MLKAMLPQACKALSMIAINVCTPSNSVLDPAVPALHARCVQGGPGFESAVPTKDLAWLAAASKHFRVILPDCRGTGRSAPLRPSTLAQVGNVEAQAQYIQHFRADSIVADAEALRKALAADADKDKARWSILGQSFGGFCCVHYLGEYPEGALLCVWLKRLPALRDGCWCGCRRMHNTWTMMDMSSRMHVSLAAACTRCLLHAPSVWR